MIKPIKAAVKRKTELSSTVHISGEVRATLEKLAIAVSFAQGKQMSSSAFMKQLVIHFGEELKDKLIKEFK
jgi:hypothetical protein